MISDENNLKLVFKNKKKYSTNYIESNQIGLKSVQQMLKIHDGTISTNKRICWFKIFIYYKTMTFKYTNIFYNIFIYNSTNYIESNQIGLKSVQQMLKIHDGTFMIVDNEDNFTVTITIPLIK